MAKKFNIILLLIFTTFFLTSCWDARPIDQLYLVFGIGIDTSENDQYLVTIVAPTIDPQAEAKKIEISSVSNSLRNAQDNIQNKAFRRITFNNTKLFVLGEDAAKEGIAKHIDTIIRDPECRGTSRILVTEGRAVDLLNVEPEFTSLVSLYIYELLEQSFFTSTVPFTTSRQFYNEYLTSGIEPILPYVKKGNREDEYIINSTALFKGDKMIGVLTHDESIALSILRSSISDGFLTAKIEDGEYFTLRSTGGKNKIKIDIKEDKIIITHEINIKGNITELTCQRSLDEDFIKELEGILAFQIKTMCEKVINKLQNKYIVDSVGYGRYVKAYHPNIFDKKNWNKQFSDAEIKITVKVDIISLGTIK
ncbi:Ger(x)C family spore germination protein [Anaerobranca gottschalkii]|uniref:Germination protein, Ger(X)C family n=1 Tax=Anaerobranca gottschalkii DSM 13577 TaxID=1120990 RepID=A0A1H9YHL1_9FIRM|nr:Ger(x)C family spore germination protein [Anaerobranca gottschalkii]SES68074.1 germination protein, Ger(x)C family [Anaerobranca gottschalkii DSM 13577]